MDICRFILKLKSQTLQNKYNNYAWDSKTNAMCEKLNNNETSFIKE